MEMDKSGGGKDRLGVALMERVISNSPLFEIYLDYRELYRLLSSVIDPAYLPVEFHAGTTVRGVDIE